MITPQYLGRFDPRPACRVMNTRHCPVVYEATCDDLGKVCARFESEDEGPWLPELHAERDGADAGGAAAG